MSPSEKTSYYRWQTIRPIVNDYIAKYRDKIPEKSLLKTQKANNNDIAPVRQDVVKNDTTEDIAPVRQDIKKNSSAEDIAPLPENEQVNLFDDNENLPPQNVHSSVVMDSGKYASRDDFDFKANAEQLVGRIEYLTSKGNVKEVVEYANKERFIEDVKDNEYYGVPTSVLFYANEDGTTIDRKFANDLNPVTTNGKVIQNPYMKMPSSSANLDNLAPPNKKYKKKTTEIPTAKQAMKKPIDAPINKKVSFNKTEIDNNVKAVAEMQSVCDVSADKLKRTGKKPSEIFSDYFNKWGNNIRSKVFGDISLKNSSIKSEIRHGITAEKIASIEAIPDVIENGKVIFAEKKENSDVERIVVSAPIKIGEDDYLMGVMLQRDSQNQRLYLHNVVIAKETSNISEADLLTTGADKKNEHLFMSNILQNVLNVKNTVNSQSIKKEDSQIINAQSPDATSKNGSVVSSINTIPSQNNFVNEDVETDNNAENVQPVENNTNVIGDIVQKYSTEERYKNILC